MKLLQVITCSFAILLVAVFGNGCVGALYIVWWGAIGTTIRGVLLVAMAAAGLAVMLGAFVWVLFFYRRPVYETHGQALLRILLKLALPTAFCPVCLPIFLLPVDWPLPRGWVSLAAVLASGGSVTLHRSGILSICSTYKKFHHV